MTLFLISLAALVAGYFLYGLLIEKIVGRRDDSASMPAYALRDGVDFVPMPTWKVFMIQFLNIAGLGPIFGAIMGVMFGPAAFLWIVFGSIFGGAVHDYISGVISVRRGGASLPETVGDELGQGVRRAMRVLSVLLLVLVGAVFVITPSGLVASLFPAGSLLADSMFWTCIIFAYYLCATFLPVDKIIGRFYPVFGASLLFMALGLLVVLLFGGVVIPDDIASGLHSRQGGDSPMPVFPMMFVSIACGAVSGFHATQSPMMARCLKNERYARPVFYGAMIAEGIVALIWAAAAIAFTGGYEGLQQYMAQDGHSAGTLVKDVSIGWLGMAGGLLAVFGVVAAPVTTGDTAFRSARLIAADMFGYSQTSFRNRLLLTVPLFVVAACIMMIDFNVLWRYFAWTNQTMAAVTLWACAVYVARRNRWASLVALIPAMFMTVVSISYIMYAPEGLSLGIELSVACGLVAATLLFGLFVTRQLRHGRVSDLNGEIA